MEAGGQFTGLSSGASSGYVRLLLEGAAYTRPGWLPAADDCPELAGLRDEHHRLLGVVESKLAELQSLIRSAESAETERGAALQDAILAGRDPKTVAVKAPTEDEIRAARVEYEAAVGALSQWVAKTLAVIEETAPEIEAGLDGRLREAEAKRAEAQRLLAEADRLAAEPTRLRNWLARYVTVTDAFSGESRKASVLGPITFDELARPHIGPMPGGAELTFAPAEAIPVGSDELDPSEMEALNV